MPNQVNRRIRLVWCRGSGR